MMHLFLLTSSFGKDSSDSMHVSPISNCIYRKDRWLKSKCHYGRQGLKGSDWKEYKVTEDEESLAGSAMPQNKKEEIGIELVGHN